MSNITIKHYRGFDIEFNTGSEKFVCVVTDVKNKESKSFSAVKKFVDEYLKDNQTFKPFWVEKKPDNNYGPKKNEKLKIIGVRKDNRFIAENVIGEIIQISDYSTDDYILSNSENDNKIKELEELEKSYTVFMESYRNVKKNIIKAMTIVTLKEHKKTII